MIARIIAIGFIFVCTSVAWMVLAGVTSYRTDRADSGLRTQVERVWGTPQAQQQPSARWMEKVSRKVESVEDGKKVTKMVDVQVPHALPLLSSAVDVGLRLDPRQKGLLWYSTYAVDFAGSYVIANNTEASRDVEISLPFPSSNAVFDDLQFELQSRAWQEAPSPSRDHIVGQVRLEPGERVILRAGYRSQGLDRWSYGFGEGIADVRDFRLSVRTNFAAIDFPDGSISPARKDREGAGWNLTWEFRRLVSGVNIAVAMPEKLQPGPLASQIAGFAPVSLFFFIVVLLTIGIVKGYDIHPMHFFFLAAAFFAFHLLFAYLVDLVDIHLAFALAALVSLGLTASYLRVVFGARFAFLAAGVAQLVYLVLFSYAFFFKGLTGIAITVGAVATLFVLMQATARIHWGEIFSRRLAGAPA
ncbi:MAG TPA: hypothetical protein VJQ51_12200 [Burkholderiales bacterium]|nr:hypothetical protein [Burkholderiales bacterium]